MSYFGVNGHVYFDDYSRGDFYTTSICLALSKRGLPSLYDSVRLKYHMSDKARKVFGDDTYILEDIFNIRSCYSIEDEYYHKIMSLNYYFCNSIRLFVLPVLLEDYVAFAKKNKFTYCWLADYVSEKLR